MEATVSYLLMLRKYINSKQKTYLHYALFLGNISKDFTINNMKKTGLKGVVKFVYFVLFDTNDILDIHKYLIKRT